MRMWMSMVWVLIGMGLCLSGCGGGSNSSPRAVSAVAGGTLDSSFGTGGIVTFAPHTYNLGEDILIQPDGKILVLGYSQQDTSYSFFLSRYNADGTLDGAFGDGGVVYGPSQATAESLALQRDGKILVAGHSYEGTNNITSVTRYHADGKIDAAFGSEGSVLTHPTSNQSNVKIAVQADGKIVLAATEWNGGATSFMLRLNGNGTLDDSFGSGSVGKSYLSGSGSVGALAIGADDSILVGVNEYIEGAQEVSHVYKFDQGGMPDTSFGSAGKYTAAEGMAHQYIVDMKLDKAGNVVVAMGIDRQYEGGVIVRSGKVAALASQTDPLIPYPPNTSVSGVAVLRLQPDGSPDPAFGEGGSVMYTSGSRGLNPSALVIQPDGKLILSGSVYNNASALAIMKLNAEGSIDNSFGTVGLITTSIDSYGTDGRGIALQGDGKVVVVGRTETQSGDQYPSSMVLVRCFP